VTSLNESSHAEDQDDLHLKGAVANKDSDEAGSAAQAALSVSGFPMRNNRALRVLYAVDSKFPRLGGAENQALKLANALRGQGVQVAFVAPRVDKSQPLDELYQGFSITRIDYPTVRWLGSLVLMVRCARYLIKHAEHYDAVHVHITHLMAAAAGYARSRSGLPVITKISGFYEFEGGVLDPSARYKPLNLLIRRGLVKVDYVQTISRQTRQKLLDAGFTGQQIQFIPNGIDLHEVPGSLPSAEPLRIGYCGRLREIKGVHVLLDGFALLKAAHPQKNLQLVIAGSGETRPALEAQARDLGIDADIDWLGTIDDTCEFFRSIHLYVQPSFAEGLPNSVMEAMAAERPVIASDIGGNNDLIDDGVSGVLFPKGDATALSTHLGRLLDDPQQCRQLASAGRALMVEQYGFESITRKLAVLYLDE